MGVLAGVIVAVAVTLPMTVATGVAVIRAILGMEGAVGTIHREAQAANHVIQYMVMLITQLTFNDL